MKRAVIYKIDKWNPEREIIKIAAEAIVKGKLVAFPTETVYGLGANAMDEDAVRGIFSAKGRPCDNPLIVHVANVESAKKIAHTTPRALRLMERFWPGPLTLVMKAKDIVPKATRGGLETVAVRMPAHPVALALIEKSGVPLAAPSANTSGRPSPTDANVVYDDLGSCVDMILDAGPTDVGVESTVIDVTQEKVVLLRPGGLPVETIEEFGEEIMLPDEFGANRAEDVRRKSPGARYRHYAPRCRVVLWRDGDDWPVEGAEAVGYIGIKRPSLVISEKVILFDSLEHYARGLFMAMRYLEKKGVKIIVADYPAKDGLGLAIRDRLYRASSAEFDENPHDVVK